MTDDAATVKDAHDASVYRARAARLTGAEWDLIENALMMAVSQCRVSAAENERAEVWARHKGKETEATSAMHMRVMAEETADLYEAVRATLAPNKRGEQG